MKINVIWVYTNFWKILWAKSNVLLKSNRVEVDGRYITGQKVPHTYICVQNTKRKHNLKIESEKTKKTKDIFLKSMRDTSKPN